MSASPQLIEVERRRVQGELDAAKTQAQRNKLGQFATPGELATEILEYAKSLLPHGSKIRFMDPAFGTGAFYSALLRVFSPSRLGACFGYEIDPHYGDDAARLWRDAHLRLEIADFTKAAPPVVESAKANLIICNPPYVRHHHLQREDKQRLGKLAFAATGVELSGLTGLYCYFLCLSHAWMAKKALAGWLIPSEFMDVNYGRAVKEYLLTKVRLLRIHRFDPADVQFDDALVSSALVWFTNEPPQAGDAVEFSYGGTLSQPRISKRIGTGLLTAAEKWTKFPQHVPGSGKPGAKLGDLFTIKRGIATGANDFFIMTPEEAASRAIPKEFLRPILPSPRYVHCEEIKADEAGNPLLEKKLFLLSCNLPQGEVRSRHPALWSYLQQGVKTGIASGYLCQHRDPWYTQEHRSAAPILFTYMGRQDASRGWSLRFILNHSKAITANVYLMLYPKGALAEALAKNPGLIRRVWQALTSISAAAILGGGRVYGGGLHKVEPKELAAIPADAVLAALQGELETSWNEQLDLPLLK